MRSTTAKGSSFQHLYIRSGIYHQFTKPKLSNGAWQHSRKVARCASNILKAPLIAIFNPCLWESLFPSFIKNAKILTIHKQTAIDVCGNHKPISMLPIFSKVFEKLVNNQILDFLEANNLIFKKNSSLEKVLTPLSWSGI